MDTQSEAHNSSEFLQNDINKNYQCPSCSLKLNSCEDLAKHCEQETEQLRSTRNLTSQTRSATRVQQEIVENNEEQRKPYTIFQRVQRNRRKRQRQVTRKRTSAAATAPQNTEQTCPLCYAKFTQEDIQNHVESCLRKQQQTARDDDSSDEDDDGDNFEEYEWAGQKRVRVSSMLQGGYASLGIGQSSNSLQRDDEDEDLNVDEDDTQIYGPPQYEESDVIPTTADQNGESGDVTAYMRSLITGNTNNTTNNGCASTVDDKTKLTIPTDEDDDMSLTDSSENSQNYKQIISSLKSKLRHYENHVQSKFKCLICLDDYRNPAISVSCWHVHCEECWLRSLGARKLCPQCNLITTPKDLRRIYM